MFFTAEDERARIKGSVDPLGLMSVWSEREFYREAIRDAQLGEGNQSVRDRQPQCARLMVECDVLDDGRSKYPATTFTNRSASP